MQHAAPLRATRMDWESEYVRNFVAVEQDLAASDLAATALLPGPLEVPAQIIAGVDLLCVGLPLVKRIFRNADHGMEISLLAQEGQEVRRDETVTELRGDAGAIQKAAHSLECLGAS